MPKFRNGDIVYNWYGSRFRIIRSYGKNNDIYYVVESLSNKIEYNFKESELSLTDMSLSSQPPKKEFVPISPNCPKCGTTWTKSAFGAKKWYDCLKCKKKAEDCYSKIGSDQGSFLTFDEDFGEWSPDDEDR